MKVAVLNYAADVGKTILTRHLLRPRLEASDVCSVSPFSPLDGQSTLDLMQKVHRTQNAILDVPYWQTEAILQSFVEYRGAHKDYDFILVPTTAGSDRVLRGTISTILALQKIGVPAERVRVVFNGLKRRMDVFKAFAPLYGYWDAERTFVWNTAAVIHQSELFRQTVHCEMAFAEFGEIPIDLGEDLPAIEDAEDRDAYVKWGVVQRMVPGVVAELDVVFRTLVRAPSALLGAI
ncbi:MAG: hypothetical protein P4L57_14450 [Rhizomicrobium sp.]|nr:hypothetical protein [Rhizomicrobium sp.]